MTLSDGKWLEAGHLRKFEEELKCAAAAQSKKEEILNGVDKILKKIYLGIRK